jgi:hypothetical protein
MPRSIELFTVYGAKILVPTDRAVKVNVGGDEFWLPFSEIREPDSLEIRASRGEEIDLVIPVWLAKEKGLL